MYSWQGFHPLTKAWFTEQFGQPTAIQQQAWHQIRAGQDTLISAPTGSGKTLAALLCQLDSMLEPALQQTLPDHLEVLYLSPLRALSRDIHVNLHKPLQGLAHLAGKESLPLRIALRTGDTSPAERAAMVRKTPHWLITTPESLYLLLTSIKGRAMLAQVKTVIIDEIHALIDNRRGSHLSLSLARLDALCGRPPQRIGLSATVKPLAVAAAFLTGADNQGQARPCQVVAESSHRPIRMSIVVPSSPLEGLISAEVWQEIYGQLAQWIGEHRSTLIFVNSRRLAERITLHLAEHVPPEHIAAHHGSLSGALRQRIEARLRAGELKAIVATSSLELGIDVGDIDLMCQIGAVQQISTFLQRAGRACHQVGGVPNAKLLPLSRDELVQATALCQAIAQQELEDIAMEQGPLDVLAQQITAEVSCQSWSSQQLYQQCRLAMPYRQLSWQQYSQVVAMLQQGFASNQGQRGALLFADQRYGMLEPRKSARLIALTCGGAIPEQAEYKVVVQPMGQVVGTIHEDYAIDSSIGDIFQLGSTSWRMLGLKGNEVWVEDANHQSPSVPFWFGEGPGRSPALSQACHRLYLSFSQHREKMAWRATLPPENIFPQAAFEQLYHYLASTQQALGAIPHQQLLIAERFFDEAGGMQLIVHAPLGVAINRAWGLALRKRFCKHFNVELQAAATDNHVLLSLSEVHSFPLASIFQFLSANTVKDVLVQALLDSPLFAIRWRWNGTRALAIRRRRNGKKTPPHILRMQTEDLLAAVFPDQVACLENIVGERTIPDHPLVHQTLQDCLHEAMDIEGLQTVLQQIAKQSIVCKAVDTPEPSPAAHEVLLAKSYAFLDDAPLEERRTRAVVMRRNPKAQDIQQQGPLPPQAVEHVVQRAWPQAFLPIEIHDALQQLGLLHPQDCADEQRASHWLGGLEQLQQTGRAFPYPMAMGTVWVAWERLPMLHAIYPQLAWPEGLSPPLDLPGKEEAVMQLVLQQMQYTGLTSAQGLAQRWQLELGAIETALAALEQQGAILQGYFLDNNTLVWCERRLLARIHRQQLRQHRRSIQPITGQQYMQMLLLWQGLLPQHQRMGKTHLHTILEQLDGFVAAAGCWEQHILPARLQDFDSSWLNELCLQGQLTWERVQDGHKQRTRLTRQTPIRLSLRSNHPCWQMGRAAQEPIDLSQLPSPAQQLYRQLEQAGPSFLEDLQRTSGLMRQPLQEALALLLGAQWIGCDGFPRFLWRSPTQRRRRSPKSLPRLSGTGLSPSLSLPMQQCGRWWLRPISPATWLPEQEEAYALLQAELLLKRWGVICRRILQREQHHLPWWRLIRALQRLEDRGQAIGGFFIEGLGGPQFMHPDGLALLEQVRLEQHTGSLQLIHSSDPVNLTGYVLPGERIAARLQDFILLREGLPIGVGHLHQWQALIPLEQPIHTYVQSWHQSIRPQHAKGNQRVPSVATSLRKLTREKKWDQ